MWVGGWVGQAEEPRLPFRTPPPLPIILCHIGVHDGLAEVEILYLYLVKTKHFSKFLFEFFLTKFSLICTKFYQILLSFTSFGTKCYQIPED